MQPGEAVKQEIEMTTRAYANGWTDEYDRQMAAGQDVDNNACIAAGRAAEQAQRDTGIEPVEMDTRNRQQYMSINPNTYGESVWL